MIMSLLRSLLLACFCIAALTNAVEAQHIAAPRAERVARKAATVRSAQLAAVPTLEYSHGDPTAEEQYILELINRARANPRDEGVRLATTTDANIRGAYNFFNVDTGRVRADFATYPAKPPLAFNAMLITAARRHTNDMRLNNFQGHVGTDGSTFDQRIVQAGFTSYTSLGENVGAYAYSLWYGHVGFNVDWGNPDMGHRHNIMNFDAADQVFTEFGVGVADLNRPWQQNQVGPIIITEEFARNSNGPFLVGVVYNDVNSNGFYDLGEGLSGVRVTPSSGTYYATTSTSGGYAIPVKTAAASFTVTFANGPLASSYTRNVTVAGESVKLDLVPTTTPGAVSLVRPLPGAIVSSDTVRFTWRKPMPNVDRYRLQIATDSMMTSLVYNDSAITDTTRVRLGLVNGTKYFWNVRAHNVQGWGDVSATQSFRFVLLPATVRLVAPAQNGRVLRTDARFAWNRPAGPVAKYHFELAHDAAMSNLFMSDTSITDTVISVTEMDADRYYWRVRARNDAGWGPFSEIRTVDGVTSGVDVNEVRVAPSVAIAPNVAGGNRMLTATINSVARGDLRVDIIDAAGARVARLYSGFIGIELVVLPIDVSSFAHGTYFVQVVTPTSIVAVPFEVSR